MTADGAQPMSTDREDGAPSRFNRILNVLSIVLLVVAVALVALYLIPSKYYLLLPGDAVEVGPLIHVAGHSQRLNGGKLYLTDVSFLKADHLLVELYGRLNSGADLETQTQFTGGISESKYIAINTNLMTQSINAAKAAALNTIPGLHPHLAKTGPKIDGLVPGTNAVHVLKPGDVITQIDGRRIHTTTAVRATVQTVHPGQILHMTILRKGKPLHLNVRTVRANANGLPDKHGKLTLIGIEVEDQIVFPIKITISHGSIVGPSAGLMFSLGIVNDLSKTDITKGCKIAGTGTIDSAGNVGAIGGAKQKIIAAGNAGVKYFLVPDVAENRVPAEQHRGNITVVPVKTLKGALTFLKHMPACTQ
jgi:PDZ domain-containing protein